jgi:hypothetical protein
MAYRSQALALVVVMGMTTSALAAEAGAVVRGLPGLAALTTFTPLTDEELDRIEGQNPLATLRLTCPGGPCQLRVGNQVVALPQGTSNVQVSTTQVTTTEPNVQNIINEVRTEGQTVINQVRNTAQPVINEARNEGQIVITPPGNSGPPVTIQASTLSLLSRLF